MNEPSCDFAFPSVARTLAYRAPRGSAEAARRSSLASFCCRTARNLHRCRSFGFTDKAFPCQQWRG
eukprot:7425088-Pyramimonas_sp.AAC.1